MNASRNSTPHGPVAIPPKHGQFQLISPLGNIRPDAGSVGGKTTVLGSAWSSFVTKITVSFPYVIFSGMTSNSYIGFFREAKARLAMHYVLYSSTVCPGRWRPALVQNVVSRNDRRAHEGSRDVFLR